MLALIASMLSFGVSYAAWASDPVSADYACEEQEGIHYSTLHMPIKKNKDIRRLLLQVRERDICRRPPDPTQAS